MLYRRTWSVHPAQFSISGFTGELEGVQERGLVSSQLQHLRTHGQTIMQRL